MCSPVWAITDPPHAAHEEASSSTAMSRRPSATSSPTRSLPRRARHLGRRVSLTKDVRRATCPLDAPVPVNAAGGSYGNWACPRFFRRPRAAGTIGRRSATGTVGTTGHAEVRALSLLPLRASATSRRRPMPRWLARRSEPG